MAQAAAIVLAAGDATRFGGGKLLAPLDGRPLLQHVLDLAAMASLEPVVVVLGRDAASAERACTWRGERRILNERPDAGISGSVRLGLAELEVTAAARAVVLLGDQPRLTVEQVRSILDVSADPARPIVVPCYGGVPGNPVLIERAAWPMAADLRGDYGMSQLVRARPELVRHIELPGTNPDVDTRADLRRLEEAP